MFEPELPTARWADATDAEVSGLLAEPDGPARLAATPHLLHGWAQRHTQDALDHLQQHPDSPARADLFEGLFIRQQRTDGNLLGLPIAGLPRGGWADRLAGLFRNHQPDPAGRADVFRQFTRLGGVLQRETDLADLHDWLAGPVGLDPAAAPDLFPARIALIADDLDAGQVLTPAALAELRRAADPHAALAAAACRIRPLPPGPAAELVAVAVELDPTGRDRTSALAGALVGHCAPAKGRHDARWLAGLVTAVEHRGVPAERCRAVLYGGLAELVRRPGASPLDDDRLRARCVALGVDEHAPAAVRDLIAAAADRPPKRRRTPRVPRLSPGGRRRLLLRVVVAVTILAAATLGYRFAPHPRPRSHAVAAPPSAGHSPRRAPTGAPLLFTVRYESRFDNADAVDEFRRRISGRVARQVTLTGFSATAETGLARAGDLRAALLDLRLPGLTTGSVAVAGRPTAAAGQRGTVQFVVLLAA